MISQEGIKETQAKRIFLQQFLQELLKKVQQQQQAAALANATTRRHYIVHRQQQHPQHHGKSRNVSCTFTAVKSSTQKGIVPDPSEKPLQKA
ncbi:ADM_collapsed_G0057250.mRNA.1.CDS.1 [Saccharomyces cerevisiae]|nr:ADM_collapsed_G0057250.mRNA.1.CDS.1 [Saccharomyces cerevisiae]